MGLKCHNYALNLYIYSSSSSSQIHYNPVLSSNNAGGQIYFILLEIALTYNLHLERLLASLAFSPTFLLCSTTAVNHVFFGLPLFLVRFPLNKSGQSLNFIHKNLDLDVTAVSHLPAVYSIT